MSHWLTRAAHHTVYYGFTAVSYGSHYCTIEDLDSPSNGYKASPQRPQAPCPSHDVHYRYRIALTSKFPLHSNYTANALVHTPQILVLDLAAFASITTALVNAAIATFAIVIAFAALVTAATVIAVLANAVAATAPRAAAAFLANVTLALALVLTFTRGLDYNAKATVPRRSRRRRDTPGQAWDNSAA